MLWETSWVRSCYLGERHDFFSQNDLKSCMPCEYKMLRQIGSFEDVPFYMILSRLQRMI